MFKDTSYALFRRLDFIQNTLREFSKNKNQSHITIADIGCGTGELLTLPLSLQLRDIATIYAYEPEAKSFSRLIQQVKSLDIDNIQPVQDISMLLDRKYDAIIISEVLEHVENPINFLQEFRKMINENGIMMITTPNGYGIFELETMIFNTLDIIGVIPLLKNMRRKLNPSRWNAVRQAQSDTLAISPHINFFSLKELYFVIHEAGLSLTRIEGRNFAAGPFSDKIIDKSSYLIKINSFLGKILPIRLATDWMLVAEIIESRPDRLNLPRHPFKIGLFHQIYTSYKKWLNLSIARRNANQTNNFLFH